jgi:CO/xanthine dehydrogenase FAD-binding subunit
VQDVRLVLAGFSEYPIRLEAAEDTLKGATLSRERVARAADNVDDSLFTTTEQSTQYSLYLARVLIQKVLAPFSLAATNL